MITQLMKLGVLNLFKSPLKTRLANAKLMLNPEMFGLDSTHLHTGDKNTPVISKIQTSLVGPVHSLAKKS